MEFKPIKRVASIKNPEIQTGEKPYQAKTGSEFQVPVPKTPVSFSKNQLFYEGQPLSTALQRLQIENPQALSKMASELGQYYQWALKKKKKSKTFWKSLFGKKSDEVEDGSVEESDMERVAALCEAYIQKISEIIAKSYQQRTAGLVLHFDEQGILILNGVNVELYLQHCEAQPNEKSLVYLKGLRLRLEQALEQKRTHPNYPRFQEIIQAILDRMSKILDN